MNNKIKAGINFLAHDSSVTYLDLEKEEIFAIENERISRIKHDGISIAMGLSELKKYLNISNHKLNWDLSFCYENEDLIKDCSHVWKKNILVFEIRKIFNSRFQPTHEYRKECQKILIENKTRS